ncbi:MAG: transposase family protein [Prevotella sp.]|nr:transposase family protein [Prevotella sp.]
MFRKLQYLHINRKKKHKPLDIIISSIIAVLCGAESWDSIESFGKMNLAFLKQVID